MDSDAHPALDWLTTAGSRIRDLASAMLNWLTDNCELFGLNGQNWMLVVGGGLALYIAVLVISQRRQTGIR
jgi:hypothetical protein